MPDPVDTSTPSEVRARDVWRELATQKAAIDSTAKIAAETHGIVISLAGDISTMKDESRRTAEYTGKLVDLAQRREDRDARQEERVVAVADAATAREAERAAARATFVTRTAGRLVDWWVSNWTMIMVAVAVLLGVNVQPLLRAFGAIAPAPVEIVAVQPTAAPVLPTMAPVLSTTAAPPPPEAAPEAPAEPAPD